jgi:hypothetical protein
MPKILKNIVFKERHIIKLHGKPTCHGPARTLLELTYYCGRGSERALDATEV